MTLLHEHIFSKQNGVRCKVHALFSGSLLRKFFGQGVRLRRTKQQGINSQCSSYGGKELMKGEI